MAAYSRAAAGASSPPRSDGYTATRHQREVGTGYFDQVAQVISGGTASTLALDESTEARSSEMRLSGAGFPAPLARVRPVLRERW